MYLFIFDPIRPPRQWSSDFNGGFASPVIDFLAARAGPAAERRLYDEAGGISQSASAYGA